jgi:hypothetical protein
MELVIPRATSAACIVALAAACSAPEQKPAALVSTHVGTYEADGDEGTGRLELLADHSFHLCLEWPANLGQTIASGTWKPDEPRDDVDILRLEILERSGTALPPVLVVAVCDGRAAFGGSCMGWLLTRR